jgi:alginate O-acetyltransferase complex protein AlgI
VNTEITEYSGNEGGWIFYDAECRVCRNLKRAAAPLLAPRGFRFVPLQAKPAPGFPVPVSNADEMRLLKPDGSVVGGADAVVAIARDVWWAWPLWAFALIPRVMPVLRFAYRRVAARRNCLHGRCATRTGARWPTWALPLAALATRGFLPPWVFMWAMTGALFFAFKWLAWIECRPNADRPRAAGYFFAYAGMDPRNFFADDGGGTVRMASGREWFYAIAKTLAGVGLVWMAARLIATREPCVAAWGGIVGLILFLHFGVAELAALAWRDAGVNATSLMRTPLAATSLNDFWGHRWNTAFSELARKFVLRPLARRWGVETAALGVFLVSGLVHELVITVPARGGYGMPTAYFAIQGVAARLQRSAVGRRIRAGRGACGWLFTAAVLVTPLPLLCPEVFLHRVILPMLCALPGVAPRHL